MNIKISKKDINKVVLDDLMLIYIYIIKIHLGSNSLAIQNLKINLQKLISKSNFCENEILSNKL